MQGWLGNVYDSCQLKLYFTRPTLTRLLVPATMHACSQVSACRTESRFAIQHEATIFQKFLQKSIQPVLPSITVYYGSPSLLGRSRVEPAVNGRISSLPQMETPDHSFPLQYALCNPSTNPIYRWTQPVSSKPFEGFAIYRGGWLLF